jgi:hypothetical protein
VFMLSPAVKSLYGLKLGAQALAFQSCVSAWPRFEVFMRSRAYGWPLTLSPVFLLRPVLRSLYGLKLVGQASAFSRVFVLLPDLRYFYGLKLACRTRLAPHIPSFVPAPPGFEVFSLHMI